MSALKEHKPSIMVALGAPLDAVVPSILEEIRPQLPEALRRLSDELPSNSESRVLGVVLGHLDA
jgi:hypothetical protein